MNTSLLYSSLEALSRAPSTTVIPTLELANHHRNIAFGYMQIFFRFASEICGCADPQDRVKLRKAVFHQTVGLKLKEFNTSDRDQLTILARMECPVSLVSDESSPSKVILASKVLRSHLSLNEATTCRGCSKRGKCSFVRKVVPTKVGKTSLGTVAKILFGISQICQKHLADPLKFPLVISSNEFEAAIDMTSALTEFLQPSATDRQLANLNKADEKAIRRIIKIQLEKKSKQKNDPKISDATSTAQDEWIEEGSEQINLKFTKLPDGPNPTTVLDDFIDKPIIVRNVVLKKNHPQHKTSPIKMSTIKALPSLKSSTTPSGGYVTERKSSEAYSKGVEYIKPEFLRGKRVMDNVKLASKLFENKDMAFLKKIPFETVVNEPLRNTLVLAKVLKNEKLIFPKLPQWDTSTKKLPGSFTTEKLKLNESIVERVNTDYSKLLRPKITTAKKN